MEPIKRNDTGAAVEDVQTRLARIGHLPEDAITGLRRRSRRRIG